MKTKIILPTLAIGVTLLFCACGDSPSDQITSTDVTCLHIMEAGGSCNGSSATSNTVTVSSVTTVTNSSSSVVTVTTVGSNTGA